MFIYAIRLYRLFCGTIFEALLRGESELVSATLKLAFFESIKLKRFQKKSIVSQGNRF